MHIHAYNNALETTETSTTNRIGANIDKRINPHLIEQAGQWPTSVALDTNTLVPCLADLG